MSQSTPVGPPFWMRLLGGPLGAGTDLGLLILRVGFAGMMAFGHGLGKFQQLSSPPTEWPDPFGMGVTNSFYGTVGAEFFCALLVLVGLLTRLAALPLIVAMAVAAFIVHKNDPLFMGQGLSKEPAIVYGLAFLALFFTGPGRFSIDGLMMQPRKEG